MKTKFGVLAGALVVVTRDQRCHRVGELLDEGRNMAREDLDIPGRERLDRGVEPLQLQGPMRAREAEDHRDRLARRERIGEGLVLRGGEEHRDLPAVRAYAAPEAAADARHVAPVARGCGDRDPCPVQESGGGLVEQRAGGRAQLIVAPVCFTTVPHFSYSARMKGPNCAGPM